MSESSDVAARDPWDALRSATSARVGLGRAGSSMPTAALLAFELDQARARDAVHRALDVMAVVDAVAALGVSTMRLHSEAADRATYLLRPDLGRRLDDRSRSELVQRAARGGRDAADGGGDPVDVAIVIADGLSATGIQAHAVPLVAELLPRLDGLSIGPVAVVEQARVAIGDPIGEALGARLVVVVIGERPGLTSPDSIGCYLTFAPRAGRHDAERNCISNIRPEGLAPGIAAVRLAWLIRASLRLSLSGVALKDDSLLVEAGGGSA